VGGEEVSGKEDEACRKRASRQEEEHGVTPLTSMRFRMVCTSVVLSVLSRYSFATVFAPPYIVNTGTAGFTRAGLWSVAGWPLTETRSLDPSGATSKMFFNSRLSPSSCS